MSGSVQTRVLLVQQPRAVMLVPPTPRPAQLVIGVGGAPAITGYARETTLQALLDRTPTAPLAQGLTLAQLQGEALATAQGQDEIRDLLDGIDDDTLQLVLLLSSISSRLQTDALTDAQLRASAPAVRDDYDGDAVTEDQAGADAVLDFATGPLQLVAVDVDPDDPQDEVVYLCRATVDGSAPTVARGWRCRSGQTTYLPVPCPGGTVRVWAPAGVSVSVQGGVRAP